MFIATILGSLGFGCSTESTPFGPNPSPTLTVTTLTPQDGSYDVSPRAKIVLSFPLSMDARSINRSTILLTESTPTAIEKRRVVAAQVLFDATRNTATVVPDGFLKENTEYQVLVQDVRSTSKILFNAKVATFTTGNDVGTRPTVLSITPVSGQAATSVTAPIIIRFSKPMDHSSLLTSLSIAPSVVGTATFIEVPNTTMTFVPSVPLPRGREVTVTLRGDARDTQGFTLGESVVHHFFVEDPPRVLLETVSPLADSLNITLTPVISLEFSQEMNPDSVRVAFSLYYGSTTLGMNDGVFTFQTSTADPFNAERVNRNSLNGQNGTPSGSYPPHTRMIFTLNTTLPASTRVTIRIDGRATSIRGLGLDPVFLSSFTTGT